MVRQENKNFEMIVSNFSTLHAFKYTKQIQYFSRSVINGLYIVKLFKDIN